jgi:hypothetical protein
MEVSMPRPKDYLDLKEYYDFQRKKDYHRKFIDKLIESPTLREQIYELVIKSSMFKNYQVPKNYFVGDELPQMQPPQIKWAWNCLNYRVHSVQRPFIFMKKQANGIDDYMPKRKKSL